MFAIFKLQAQDYQISFTGTGQSTTIDSVHILNLTQGTSLTLNGSDLLHLVSALSIYSLTTYENNVQIYPNPMSKTSKIEFYNSHPAIVCIEIFDVLGKIIIRINKQIGQGIHIFEVSGLNSGVYTLNVFTSDWKYSNKIISISDNSGITSIKYLNSNFISKQVNAFKSIENIVQMQYNDGEILLFTCYSNNYSTIVTLVPTGNNNIVFELLSCTDGDNNDYTVVTIGTQTWMAENLKTTKYNDGNLIPLVTNSTSWSNLTTPGYCWYSNDVSNMNIYGALYNWYTVNTGNLCPIGWHVPSYTEWNTLINYLGGQLIAGGKLKEIGTLHWTSPNTGAINSTGFSALAGGFINKTGCFASIHNSGLWWCSSEIVSDTTSADCIGMSYSIIECDPQIQYKKYGFSVRCVGN